MARVFRPGDIVEWWAKEGRAYSSEVSGCIRGRGTYQKRVGDQAHIILPPPHGQLTTRVPVSFLRMAVKTAEPITPPVFFKEQPQIEFPAWLRALGFEDRSFVHDSAANAMLPVCDTHDLVVWVKETRAEEREYPDDPLYMVCSVHAGTVDTVSDLYAGADETVAADVIREYIREKCREDVARVIEMVAVLRRNAGRAFSNADAWGLADDGSIFENVEKRLRIIRSNMTEGANSAKG